MDVRRPTFAAGGLLQRKTSGREYKGVNVKRQGKHDTLLALPGGSDGDDPEHALPDGHRTVKIRRGLIRIQDG